MRNTHSRQGFTLVEIMIVVSIIALLAAMAVPSYLRARKRSQATAILQMFRVIDDAKEQYATESAHPSSIFPRPIDLVTYMKPGTKIYNDYASGVDTTDLIGNKVYISRLDIPPQVANGTLAAFSDVLDNPASFWGPYNTPGAPRY